MASAAVTSKKTKSPTANKNYSANLAKGGSVTVKDGVKTYSDKSLQVKGKGGISISGKDYSVNKGGSGFAPTTSVITADKMKPVPPIPLATPAPVDGLYGVANAAAAGLAALNGGTYDTKTNQIVPPPAAPAAPADNNQAIINSYLQANAGLEAPSSVNNLKEMQKMLRPKENLVNSLSGQLNTLNASRDAEMLKLEGQGRGQTGGFIGGEQARINREAAIQAMPIQAQLAIAQDDLDSARTYASQYFQAKMQDETNVYNQKKENNRLIFDYLTSAEQRRLDANEKALDREYNEKQATAKSAEAIALQAIEYGQSSLASKVMGLDPKSATYAQDVRNAMAGLRKPVVSTSEWELKDVNGVSSWVNKNTQEIKPVGGGGNNPVTLSYEDNAKFNATPEAKTIKDSVNYAQAVTDYKDAINTYGTGEVMGAGAGALTQAYSALVGATKDYYTLGSYDNGVQKLIALGIPEPSVWGLKKNRISALDTALGAAKGKIDKSVAQLEATKFGNSAEFKELANTASKFATPVQQVDFSVVLPEDDEEIGAAYGIPGSALSTSSLNPQQYY